MWLKFTVHTDAYNSYHNGFAFSALSVPTTGMSFICTYIANHLFCFTLVGFRETIIFLILSILSTLVLLLILSVYFKMGNFMISLDQGALDRGMVYGPQKYINNWPETYSITPLSYPIFGHNTVHGSVSLHYLQ